MKNLKLQHGIKMQEKESVDELIDLLAALEPEDIVRVTTKTKHPQEHGEQEGMPRG